MAKEDVRQETLITETINFIQGLPYWLKILSIKLVEKNDLSDGDYEDAIKYLCEDLEIYEESDKPELEIGLSNEVNQQYYQEALLTKLNHVSGANALKDNMTIEFHPQLTVLFGENGAGKTSYSRLLKWAFFSRSEEKILPDVFKDNEDPLKAKFFFETDEGPVEMQLPGDEDLSLTDQFSVFDSKAIVKHLDERNEFEFRPAGLVFFSDLTEVVNNLENKINEWANELISENPFVDLFEGESEIKDLIELLDVEIEIDELLEHIPYTEDDEKELEKLTKEHDELLIATKQLDKTIKSYQRIISDLQRNQKKIEDLNSHFSESALQKISRQIKRLVESEKMVKNEGLASIQSEVFDEIGSVEWRDFLQAAHEYAISENEDYPIDDDVCIFCHQELSEDASNLIRKYWVYLQSEAEGQLRQIQSYLDGYQRNIKRLIFDLFPEESRLAQWLNDNEDDYLGLLKAELDSQAELPDKIIEKIDERDINVLESVQIDYSKHDEIIEYLQNKVIVLKEGSQLEKLNKLKAKITYLNHKKKLTKHYTKIKKFVKQQDTASTLQTVRWHRIKRRITEFEKDLSSRYFSADYVERFNEEVEALNGQSKIEVDSRGAAGSSNRQLLIKGKNPSSILSASEQKVAAISDFLVELELSEINKGLIFDDPSTSLDDYRKNELAKRLVKEITNKQIIIFTHDLAFLSSLIESCNEFGFDFRCHWIENANGQPGIVYLDNTPSFEKIFKRTGKAQEWCDNARKQGPEERENSLRSGFAALRTSYEALVVFELFAGVVQRFNERVSIDSLTSVKYNDDIRDLVMDGFAQCCRYMEGHSHSDKYASKKPTIETLHEEIQRFNEIKKSIRQIAKES